MISNEQASLDCEHASVFDSTSTVLRAVILDITIAKSQRSFIKDGTAAARRRASVGKGQARYCHGRKGIDMEYPEVRRAGSITARNREHRFSWPLNSDA